MTKHSSIAILASLVFLLAGCEDPGNVGSGFHNDGTTLESTAAALETVEEYSATAFTGRLRHMAIGRYDDPLFGELISIGILRPAIDTTEVGSSIDTDDPFQLRLVFSSSVYGDTTSTSHFDIYRLEETWRGNELRFGDDIPFNDSEKVGEFTVTGKAGSVVVHLDDSWVDDYNNYLSLDEEDRNVIYRNEFPGLAIVPAPGNSKVLFANMIPPAGQESDNVNYVRFIHDIPDPAPDEDEDHRLYQIVNDWGALQSRGEPAGSYEGLALHSSLDKMIRMEPELTEEKLGGKNIASAKLVFYEDRNELDGSLPEHHVRPSINQVRLHIIDSGNVGTIVFGQSADFSSDRYESEGVYSYRIDITDYANAVLFSTPRTGQFYVSARTTTGLLFSTAVAGADHEELYPRIIITSAKQEIE